ncbi:MAG: hypothetical protein AAGI09_02785 [Pseudomonadota bacterium]
MTAFTLQEMTELSSKAINKVDTKGRRGTSMVTYAEIEALVCEVAVLRAQATPKHSHDGDTT